MMLIAGYTYEKTDGGTGSGNILLGTDRPPSTLEEFQHIESYLKTELKFEKLVLLGITALPGEE